MRARVVAGLHLVLLLGLPGAALGQLGTVTFPNSGSPTAQESFIRGVLLLHSFEYGPAAAAFRRAQEEDPGFALAYWGEAMTYNHPVWFRQDRDAARAVLDRLAPTPGARQAKAPTVREKEYLAAVEILFGDGPKASRDTAYAEAMRALTERYPDDPEAKAFYALALLGTSHGGRHVPTYMRAGAVAEEVFRDNPSHPGAVHYMIHSYDDPVHAPLGLRAARAYSRIAPAASHAQHMTSHIFVALGMWDEVVAANEASYAVSGNRNYHALYWLAYGLLQQGRYDAALARLHAIRQNPRPEGVYLGRMWATHVIATRPWDRPNGVLEIPMSEDDIARTSLSLFADGFLALHQQDRARAERRIAQLEERLARAAGVSEHDPSVVSVTVPKLELEAMIALADGDQERAIRLMEDAMQREDAMPFEFGPPVIVKPSHELFGEMLLDLGRPGEAIPHFERALQLAPRRALSLLGLARAADAAGDPATAATAWTRLREIWHSSDPDLPELAEVTQTGH